MIELPIKKHHPAKLERLVQEELDELEKEILNRPMFFEPPTQVERLETLVLALAYMLKERK